MNNDLTEEEMRRALFGGSETPSIPVPSPVVTPTKPVLEKPPRPTGKRLSPKLRVSLYVTREFEGDEELFVHEANTLSTFEAEQEAKAKAKLEGYRFFELDKIVPIESSK